MSDEKCTRCGDTPPRRRGSEPKPPAWWRTFWRRPGTVVEYLGVYWQLDVVGVADQSWRKWVRVQEPTDSDFCAACSGPYPQNQIDNQKREPRTCACAPDENGTILHNSWAHASGDPS